MPETDPLFNGDAADEEQPAAATQSEGFASGYADWSNTFKAFEELVFHFSVYMILGIVFYSFILDTKLSIIDSVYFSVAVFTTVGYGDISPAENGSIVSMLFTVFFALYGIVILGIFLGIVGDYFVNKEQEIVANLKKAAKDKVLKTLHKAGTDTTEEESDSSDPEYDTDSPVYKWLAKRDRFAADLYIIVKDNMTLIYIVIFFGIPIIVKEKWSVVEGMYWLAITGTTIGLGDEAPVTDFSRLYGIFFYTLYSCCCW